MATKISGKTGRKKSTGIYFYQSIYQKMKPRWSNIEKGLAISAKISRSRANLSDATLVAISGREQRAQSLSNQHAAMGYGGCLPRQRAAMQRDGWAHLPVFRRAATETPICRHRRRRPAQAPPALAARATRRLASLPPRYFWHFHSEVVSSGISLDEVVSSVKKSRRAGPR